MNTDSTASEAEVFACLDRLRESGLTNMFGAGEYIEAEFTLTRSEARRLLASWMQTFPERHHIDRLAPPSLRRGTEF